MDWQDSEVEVDCSNQACYRAIIKDIRADGVEVSFINNSGEEIGQQNFVDFDTVKIPTKKSKNYDYKVGDIIEVLSISEPSGRKEQKHEEGWWRAKINLVKGDHYYVEFLDCDGHDLVKRDVIRPFDSCSRFSVVKRQISSAMTEVNLNADRNRRVSNNEKQVQYLPPFVYPVDLGLYTLCNLCQEDEVHKDFIKHSGVLAVIFDDLSSELVFVCPNEDVEKKARLLSDMHTEKLLKKAKLLKKQRNEYKETFRVHNDLVGLVIGKNGSNVKKVEQMDGIKSVKKMKCQDSEDFKFTVVGKKDDVVKKARSMLEFHKEEFVVPNYNSGSLEDKQLINDIKDKSMVLRINKDISSEGVKFIIIGNPEKIKTAKLMLQYQIDVFKDWSMAETLEFSDDDNNDFIEEKKRQRVKKNRDKLGRGQGRGHRWRGPRNRGQSHDNGRRSRVDNPVHDYLSDEENEMTEQKRQPSKDKKGYREGPKEDSPRSEDSSDGLTEYSLYDLNTQQGHRSRGLRRGMRRGSFVRNTLRNDNSDVECSDRMNVKDQLTSRTDCLRGRGLNHGQEDRGHFQDRGRGRGNGRKRRNRRNYNRLSSEVGSDIAVSDDNKDEGFTINVAGSKKSSDGECSDGMNINDNLTSSHGRNNYHGRRAYQRGRGSRGRGNGRQRGNRRLHNSLSSEVGSDIAVSDDNKGEGFTVNMAGSMVSLDGEKSNGMNSKDNLTSSLSRNNYCGRRAHQRGRGGRGRGNDGQRGKRRNQSPVSSIVSSDDNEDEGFTVAGCKISSENSNQYSNTLYHTNKLASPAINMGLSVPIKKQTERETTKMESKLKIGRRNKEGKTERNLPTDSDSGMEVDVTKAFSKLKLLAQGCHEETNEISTKSPAEDSNDEIKVLKVVVQEYGEICDFGVFVCQMGYEITKGDSQEFFLRRSKRFHIYQEDSSILYIAPYFRELDVCKHYFNPSKPSECLDESCCYFHICQKFVSGQCRRSDCYFPHNLNSPVNNKVKLQLGLENFTDKDIIKMLNWKFPRLCYDYIYLSEGCSLHEYGDKKEEYDLSKPCPYLHYCREQFMGKCKLGINCKLSHSFSTRHNHWVLDSCHLVNQSDEKLKTMVNVPPRKPKNKNADYLDEDQFKTRHTVTVPSPNVRAQGDGSVLQPIDISKYHQENTSDNFTRDIWNSSSMSNLGQPTSGHLGQPSSGPFEQQSTGHLGQPSTGHLGQPSTGHLGQQSTGHLGQPSSGRFGQPSTGHLRQPTSGHFGQQSTGHLGQPSSGHLGQPSTGHLGQPSTGHLGQPSSGHLGQPSTGHLGQTSSGHAGQPSTGHLGHSSTGNGIQQNIFRQQSVLQPEYVVQGQNQSFTATGVLNTKSSHRRDQSYSGSKGRLKSEKSEDILSSDVAGKKHICLALKKEDCKNPSCNDLHSEYAVPYLWQAKLDEEWVTFLPKDNFKIEQQYCDLKTVAAIQDVVYAGEICDIKITFDLHDEHTCVLNMTNARRLDPNVRRLSTPSFVDNPTAKATYLTQWRWYWEDNNKSFLLFDSDLKIYTLEVKYIKKQEIYLYSRKNYKQKYRLSFRVMSQQNIDYATVRGILRRPLYVSEADLKQKKHPQRLVSTTIELYGEEPKPEHFAPWDLAHEFELVEINLKATEYQEVLETFEKTMLKYKLNIQCIYRVQNRKLWFEYQVKKKSMYADGEKYNSAFTTVDERDLFHGTDSLDTCRGICTNNFDFRKSGKNATVYGEGSYFARDARYSHKYARPSVSGDRYMFRAKVLVGAFTQGKSGLRRPPEIPGQSHKLYDSCVDQLYDPSIFVIFDRAQSYPEYLIHYQNIASSDEFSSATRFPSSVRAPHSVNSSGTSAFSHPSSRTTGLSHHSSSRMSAPSHSSSGISAQSQSSNYSTGQSYPSSSGISAQSQSSSFSTGPSTRPVAASGAQFNQTRSQSSQNTNSSMPRTSNKSTCSVM